MKRFLLVLAIAGLGACHIISGGDEIVVAGEDDEDGGDGAGNGPPTTVTGGGPCQVDNIAYAAGDPICAACLGAECCFEVTNCDNNPGCVLFVDCLTSGFDFCEEDFPAGAAIADGIASCGAAHCSFECGG